MQAPLAVQAENLSDSFSAMADFFSGAEFVLPPYQYQTFNVGLKGLARLFALGSS